MGVAAEVPSHPDGVAVAGGKTVLEAVAAAANLAIDRSPGDQACAADVADAYAIPGRSATQPE
jgi:hypothetical protein